MKTKFILLSILLVIASIGFAFKNNFKSNYQNNSKNMAKINFFNFNKNPKIESYDELWISLEDKKSKNLYKDALNILSQIEKLANKDKNYGQLTKVKIYEFELNSLIDIEYTPKNLENLVKLADKSEFPLNNLYYLSMAEIIKSYGEGFRSSNNNVSAIEDSLLDYKEIENWAKINIYKRAFSFYQKALNNKEKLQETKGEDYQCIITKENFRHSKTISITTSLYDIICQRFLDYLISSNSYQDFDFEIKGTNYLTNAENFVELDIKCNDEFSPKYNALKLFQDLLKFHLNDTNKSDFVNFDLNRVNFIKNFGSYLYDSHNEYIDQMIEKYGHLKDIADRLYFEKSNIYHEKAKYALEKELLEKIIKEYPNSFYIPQCKNNIEDILSKELSINIESTVIPNSNFIVNLNYKNLDSITLELKKIDYNKYNEITCDYEHFRTQEDKIKAIDKNSQKVSNQTFKLINNNDYKSKNSYLAYFAPEPGFYILVYRNPKNEIVKYVNFWVSNIAESQYSNKNTNTIYIKNRKTGEPISGAKLSIIYKNNKTEGKSYISDQMGKVTFDKIISRNVFSYKITKNDDTYYVENPYQNYVYKQNSQLYANIYTDKALYRPDEKIKFKVIVYSNEGYVVENKPFKIKLIGANHDELSSFSFNTNQYGSFSGEFAIPENQLSGRYTLTIDHNAFGSTNVNVEEYKKPTFEVSLDLPKEEIVLNENIKISGNAKTFDGVGISSSKVKYKVSRYQQYMGWRSFWLEKYQANEIILEDECSTDENGNFEINFLASIPNVDYQEDNNYMTYSYTISAEVIDINGESHSKSIIVNASKLGVYLNCDINEFNCLEEGLNCKITSKNANSNHINSIVKAKIYKINNTESTLKKVSVFGFCKDMIYTKEEWEKLFPNIIYQVNDSSKEEINKNKVLIKELEINTKDSQTLDLQSIKESGYYQICLETLDKNNQISQYQKEFKVYSITKPNANLNEEIKSRCNLSSNAKVGQEIVIDFYSSMDDINLYVNASCNGKILSEKLQKINNNIYQYKYTTKTEDIGRINIYLHFIKDNKFYCQNYAINVIDTTQTIHCELTSFRDKLLPNQDEKWTIKYTDYLGKPLKAEVLALMYDKSLEAIMPYNPHHYFSKKSQNNNYNLVCNSFNTNFNHTIDWPNFYHQFRTIDLIYPQFLEINFTGGIMVDMLMYECATASPMKNRGILYSKKAVSLNIIEEDCADIEEAEEESLDNAIETQSIEGTKEEENFEDVEIRENFNTTAFFEPHLICNEKGEVSIEFTMPESLTKWQFYSLAHTSDLRSNTSSKEVITSKDFSIRPNYPRFLREDDNITIPVKIVNQSSQDISGKINFEIIDAQTLEKLDYSFTRDFSVLANTNSNQDFEIKVKFNPNPVIIRVVAKSENFSDGEQKIIPVLSNKILVTDSKAMTIRGSKSKEYTLPSNKTTFNDSEKLTLEFTQNPFWYAIESLPYMDNYTFDCNDVIALKLYVNCISKNIVDKHPEIVEIYKQKAKDCNNDFITSLEKNQELKSSLLSQTPWVLDAKNDKIQAQNVLNLFDNAKINKQLDKFIKELKENQMSCGAWSWFKGGKYDNYFVTSNILRIFGRLQNLQISKIQNNKDVNNMIKSALKYIDLKAEEHYNFIKSSKKFNPKGNYLDYFMINYVYVRSYFTQNAFDSEFSKFYLEQCKKNVYDFSLCSRAMLATALNRIEKGNQYSKTLIEGFKQSATMDEDLGMYFSQNTQGYFWYNRQIETQAAIIEAFNEISLEKNLVEELKIWLIQNRRTNQWENSTATLEACHALLNIGTNYLDDNQNLEINLREEKLEIPQTLDKTTGYFKQSFSGKEIKPNYLNVKVTNPNKGVAFGGIYFQHFEKLEDVKEQQGELQISKKLYIKQLDKNNREFLQEITNNTILKAGDKIIVRLVIKADRDFEFVHLMDLRASGLEPVSQISGYKYMSSMYYYQEQKDLTANFFIENLSKGTHTLEYEQIAVHKGEFSSGLATIQCMYAPEFLARTSANKIVIK